MTRAARRPGDLPKLTAPEAGRVQPRPRLFGQLDAARRGGHVVWVAAPAGSGKTSLVASYVQARRLRAAWFHADCADSDPATFFFYLGQLAAGARRKPGEALPAFTSEYLGGLAAFARNWFRRFFGLLGDVPLLVIDDYHQIEADSPVHAALREGLAELPSGTSVIVTSRLDPPPALTRLRTLDRFTLIDREALSLTEDECVAIARRRMGARSPDEAALRTVHRRTKGWLAGVVLMLEHGTDAPLDEERAPADPLVFDYFAGEVFAQIDAPMQGFLLRSALLPRLTPAAATRLTGMDDAAERLAELDRRNFFIVRHRIAGSGPTYEYHPLFRQFLLAQARERLPADEQVRSKHLAASLLAEEGDAAASIALLRELGEWEPIVSIVLQQAAELLRKGRFRTLAEWIDEIPPAHRCGVPWLDYYLGTCRMPFDPDEAREHLARAYAAFREKSHPVGEYLAWSGIVDTFIYAWSDFRPADPWIEEFDALRARHPRFPSGEIEVRAVAAVFSILMYRRPQDPALPRWAARIDALLAQDIDASMRMIAANHLVLYYQWWVGRVDAAKEVVRRMEACTNTQAVGPFVRLAWDAILAISKWMSAENTEALAAVEHGLALADETGAHLWDFMLAGQGAFAAATSGDAEGARAYLRRMHAGISRERRLDGVHYHFACFNEAARRDDRTAMREHAHAGLACAIEAGVLWGEVYTRPALAHSLFADGDVAGARRELQAAMRIAQQIGCANARYYVHELEALFAGAQGDADAQLAAARSLFRVMREQGFVNSAWWNGESMARLCLLALENDIETDYVRRLIRLRALRPEGPAARLGNWPWPLRIRTFGRFEIEVDGEPLRFTGKVQKRPLELLRALVAFGGSDVHEAQLAQALWPDADGDDAHNAFVTTLQRLRRMLVHREALRLQESKLSLDPQRCHLDTWAFESIDVRTGDPGDLRRATLLYRGAFLAGDEAAWAIAPRERLRARFVQAAAALAGQHATQQREDQAIACLEGALEVDDTVESFYRQLMSLQARLGRMADVEVTYRRCRDVLGSTLQVRPSPSTEALWKELIAVRSGLET